MSELLEIHPLPESSSFILGYYGLEETFIRGLLRINYHNQKGPLLVSHCVVRLCCSTLVKYYHPGSGEYIERRRIWWEDEMVLLGDPRSSLKTAAEIFESPLALDIPFEFILPENIEDNVPLIPSTFNVLNYTSYQQPYELKNSVLLTAELLQLPSEAAEKTDSTFISLLFPPKEKLHSCSKHLDPFFVFDPRNIPKLLFSEPKEWRSSPEADPCEFEFRLSNGVVGPGDPLSLAYRIAVSMDAAARGVRIKRVRFILREVHCLGSEDNPVVGTVDIAKWEQYEDLGFDLRDILWPGFKEKRKRSQLLKRSSTLQSVVDTALHQRSTSTLSSSLEVPPTPPNLGGRESSDYGDYPVEMTDFLFKNHTNRRGSDPPPYSSDSKILSRTRHRGGGSADGLYVESEGTIRVPSQFPRTFCPSIGRLEGFYEDEASFEIRHLVRVDIDFDGPADRLAFECSVTISSVGKKECERILEHIPEIIPSLEYEKVCGNEVWYPPYMENAEEV